MWIATTAGTVDSVSFALGDGIIATTDNASTSTYASNWIKTESVSDVTSVVGLTGVITKSALLAALNVEDGATADQTGAEIQTLLTTELGSSEWETQLTTEEVMDIVGAGIAGTQTRITVSYDDPNGEINFVVEAPILVYADITAAVAGQGDQSDTQTIEFTDGSGFTGITSGRVWARYLGTTVGTEADYRIISAEEWGSSSAPEGTAVLSTGEVGGSKFLREDGDGTCSWQAIPGGGDLLSTNNLSDVASAATSRTNLGLDTTANQTDSTDKRFMTDAQETKLDSVESGADVTDAANVDAAGATMNTDTDVSSNSWVLDEDNMSSDSATKVPTQQSVKAYVDDEVAGIPAELGYACSDEDTDLAAATGVLTFRMPYAMTLTEVRATVGTAPTGSAITVDINESGSTILSTKITIDATEKTSKTAATAPVISDSSLADDTEITIDIDAIGSTVAGAGLKLWLIGTRT